MKHALPRLLKSLPWEFLLFASIVSALFAGGTHAWFYLKTRNPNRIVSIDLPPTSPYVWRNHQWIAYKTCGDMNQVRLPIGPGDSIILHDKPRWTGFIEFSGVRYHCSQIADGVVGVRIGTIKPGETKRIEVQFQ